MAHALAASAWYAVHTHIRAEPLAAWHLRRQGYGVLYLRYPAVTHHARRIGIVLRPYFPRYLFAETTPGLPLGAIGRLIGVAGVVQAAGEPLRVPQEVISELMARSDPNGLVEPPQAQGRAIYAPGQEVAIASGPFAGRPAVVLIDDGERIRVVLRWLGRDVNVTIEPRVLADGASPAVRSVTN